MELQDVLRAIDSGDLDDHLREIRDVAKERESIVARRSIQSLSVGDVIRFNKNTRPKYLQGTQAVVSKINKATITVELEENVGKYRAGSPIKVPAELVELVD